MAGSSLGTAWIQIKPSMAGMANEIKQEIGAGVNQAGASAGPTFSSLFSGLSGNVSTTFSDAFSRVASTTRTVFSGAFAGVAATLTSSIDSAVSRIDTLSNASRMFEALGYSADSVSAAMSDLNSYLDGLPTTLDGAIQNIQLLSTSFGGIENGTKYFKALNDAGLAFGATSDQIQNGIAQLSQLSLDGPLDAETWNSLRDAGFAPVMAAMAEQAGITTGELKEQFGGNGSRTVQEFLDELVKLDEEGSGSMASLAEMARQNTDGIATAMTNARTAIARGVGEIIKSIPNLADSISTAGKSIEGVLSGNMGIDEAAMNINAALSGIIGAIGATLGKVVPLILGILPGLIDQVVNGIVGFLSDQESVNTLINGFVDLFASILTGAARIAAAILPLVPTIIGSLAQELTKEENIGNVVLALSALFGFAALKTVASNITKNLKSIIGDKVANFFNKDLATGVDSSKASSSLSQKISSALSGISSVASTALNGLGSVLSSTVGVVMQPLQTLMTGLGKSLAGFFSALSSPMIALGAAMFALAAASIAAAIFLIGSAVGAVMPTLVSLINEVIIPVANFIATFVLALITTLTTSIITLTQQAIIPLGTFLVGSFLSIVNQVSDAIIRLTQQAVIPLINTLSGSFTNIINSVANLISGTLNAALTGIANVVATVGSAFTSMGQVVVGAINAVNGILSTFKDLLLGIADAIVAVVALVTGQSIDYGNGFAHVTKAATGGLVGGVGTSTSDSNLFALSKGEYVVKASSARAIGYHNLEAMNNTGSLPVGQTNNFNIVINDASDPRATADYVSREIARRQKEVLA